MNIVYLEDNQTMDIYRIYRIKQAEDMKKLAEDMKELPDLTIDDKGIQFLRDVLLKNAEFKKQDEPHWVLSFFTEHMDFQQNIVVERYSPPEVGLDGSKDWREFSKSKRKDFRQYEDLCRVAFLKIKHTEQPTASEIEQASLAVRDSKSVRAQDLTEASTHYAHVDGRGMMFLSKMESPAHCVRNVILLALAYAYLGAMEKINNSLAECIRLGSMTQEDEQRLRGLYLAIAQFNAKYMFFIPVKGHNAGLVAAWHRINDALKIEKLNNELNSQINTVHHILKIDADKKQAAHEKEQQQLAEQEKLESAARDRKLNIKLWYIGFIVSLMGLISVYIANKLNFCHPVFM